MKVRKAKTVRMLVDIGYSTAPSWDDTRINGRLAKLAEAHSDETESELEEKKKVESLDLFRKIAAALKAGKEVTVIDDKVADEKQEPAPEPKAKKTEGKKKADPSPDGDAQSAATSSETAPTEDVVEEERPPVGWELVSAKTVPVTRKLATEYADMEATLVERPFKQKKADRFRVLLENGEFRPCGFAKAHCKEDGKDYRTNGQHCSKMYAEIGPADNDLYEGQFVHVEEYVCDTLADVARLFGTFDSKEQARSGNDINHSFAQTIPKVRDLDPKLVNLAVGALVYAGAPSNMGGGKHHTAAERAEVLVENKSFVLWLKPLIGEKTEDTSPLRRVPVVAAMFKTWQTGKDEAKVFWTAVRDESGEKPELPTRKLMKFLRGLAATGKLATEKVVPKTVYGKALEAWVMHKEGRTGNLKYTNDQDLPEVS